MSSFFTFIATSVCVVGLYSAARGEAIHFSPQGASSWSDADFKPTPPAINGIESVPGETLLGAWDMDPQSNFMWGSASLFTNLNRTAIGMGPGTAFNAGPQLFENLNLTTASANTEYMVRSGDDSDFPTFVATLTNGATNNPVWLHTGVSTHGWAGAVQPESTWAGSSPADFSGYQITGLALYINDIFFVSPGRDPNHNGIWTDFRIDREFRIYGRVLPEPTALVAVAGIALIGRRRR